MAFSARDRLIGCGHKWLPWKAFEAAILTFLTFTNDPIASKTIEKSANPVAATLVLTCIRYCANNPSRRLDKLLPAMTNLIATDSRDYMYALLSLATDEDRRAIIPEYSKPVAEMYTRVREHLLKLDANILCYRSDFPHQKPDGDGDLQTCRWRRRLWHLRSR